MLIAQISDLHIPKPGEKTYGIADMANHLIQCVEHINRLKPRPDCVLVTGDISSEGQREEMTHAASILAKLAIPYFIIPGNHDDRRILRKVFDGAMCPADDNGFIQYVIDQYEIRLIAMDSTILGEPGGEICPSRAQWLDNCLAQQADKPTLIFMHHPPLKCGVIETDIDGFVGAALLGKVFDKYANIEALLCGHIHRPAFSRWHGSVVSTAPSMGMQLVLDLNLKTEAFTLEAPAYQLHYWTRDKNLVTHTEYLHDAEGPFLFEDLETKSAI